MRLYHKKQESYVVAEGSFAGVFASLEEIRRVHQTHPDFKISTSHETESLFSQSSSITNPQQVPHPSLPHHIGNTTPAPAINREDRARGGGGGGMRTIQVKADIEPQGVPKHPEANYMQEDLPPQESHQAAMSDVVPVERSLAGDSWGAVKTLDYYNTEGLGDRRVVDEDGIMHLYCWVCLW